MKMYSAVMSDRSPNSASIRASAKLRAGSEAVPERLEAEVVELFDLLRNPVLRYLMGIGLPVEDAEEIVQEGFLALFQHLRAGKPRSNLRGWVFRVAHNLGLKRRGTAARAGLTNAAAGDESSAITDP